MASGDDSNWAKYTSLGFEVAAAIGLGAFGGWAVDQRLHSAPWGVIVGVLVGVAAGMYLLIKQAIDINKD
jgi:F0F1-type ATP synthase assembly protein I